MHILWSTTHSGTFIKARPIVRGQRWEDDSQI